MTNIQAVQGRCAVNLAIEGLEVDLPIKVRTVIPTSDSEVAAIVVPGAKLELEVVVSLGRTGERRAGEEGERELHGVVKKCEAKNFRPNRLLGVQPPPCT